MSHGPLYDSIRLVGRANSGTEATRRRLNMIGGTGITVAMVDDSVDDELEFTVTGHTEDHASRHADGGADEIDVISLGSGAQAANFVPESDGAGGLQWIATPGGGSSDHGGLTGLGDDDHSQYVLATGARDITGVQRLTGAPIPLILGGASDAQLQFREEANGFTLESGNNANTFTPRVRYLTSDHADGRDIRWFENDGATVAFQYDQSATVLRLGANTELGLGPNGTAALPALHWGGTSLASGFTNMGAFRVAAGNIGWSGAGAERLRMQLAAGGGGLRTDQTNGYAPVIQYSGLTAVTSVTKDTDWHDWGTETLTITWPASTPVRVGAWCVGTADIGASGGPSRCRMRVLISFDGGTSFNNPSGESGVVDTGDKWDNLSNLDYRAGTPTGNIVVKAQYQVDTGPAGMQLIGGKIMALVTGDL